MFRKIQFAEVASVPCTFWTRSNDKFSTRQRNLQRFYNFYTTSVISRAQDCTYESRRSVAVRVDGPARRGVDRSVPRWNGASESRGSLRRAIPAPPAAHYPLVLQTDSGSRGSARPHAGDSAARVSEPG